MGFGRIGRNVFRILHEGNHDVEVVAIVDVVEPKSLEYLLRFDTVHGRFEEPVEVQGDALVVRDKRIKLLNAKAPGDVDWKALASRSSSRRPGSTGPSSSSSVHLQRARAHVVLTGPSRGRRDPDRHPRRQRRHRDEGHEDRLGGLLHGERRWPRSARSSTTRSASTAPS
jgi:glyceraldehyde 3-phosphate dehydrogenase